MGGYTVSGGDGEGVRKRKRERDTELCNEFMPGWQIFISYWKNS